MSRLDLCPRDVEPVSVRASFDVRRPVLRDRDAVRFAYLAALREPLAGIPLRAYDEHMLTWLAGWHIPTVGMVSLLHRARAGRPIAGA
jgi:hypothetical protein